MKRTVGIFFALVGVSMIGAAAQAETIYANNITRSSTTYWPVMNNEMGDELNLAGTARYLTSFSFEYYGLSSTPGVFAGNVSAHVRFYQNLGTPVAGAPSPSSTFFDATISNLDPTSGSTLWFTPGDGLPVSGLFIPANNFTFSVQFAGMGAGDEVGVALYTPWTVGSSEPDYWQRANDSSPWSLKVDNGVGPIDFGCLLEASLTPVPEPTAMALLLLGAGMMAVRGRKE